MKKIIMLFALVASTVVMASSEVYSFSSSVKMPVLQGSAAKGYYRSYVASKINGTLTIDADYTNETAVINAVIVKTGQKVNLVLDDDIVAILAGKKLNVAASHFTAVDTDGTLKITCAGIGATSVKVTGCGPCGDSTTCTRVKSMSGNLVGLYDCGCTADQYPTIDDPCDVDYEYDTDIAPVYGTWKIVLKTVDGAKYK